MKKGRELLHRLLFPAPHAIPWLILPAATCVPLLLVADRIPPVIVGLCSLLAIYVLVVLAIRLPVLYRAGLGYLARMRTQPWHEKWAVLSLFLGFGANLVYAIFRLIVGAHYGAAGLGAEAVFYIVLGVIRYSLVGEERKIAKKESVEARETAHRHAQRRCGRLLLLLHAVAIAIVTEIVRGRPRAPYSALVIAITGLYTAGRLVLVAFQLIRFRRRVSPLLSSIRTLNLSASLFSAFSLTAVCLTRSALSVAAQRLWNAAAGGVVLVASLALTIRLLWRARRAQKRGET